MNNPLVWLSELRIFSSGFFLLQSSLYIIFCFYKYKFEYSKTKSSSSKIYNSKLEDSSYSSVEKIDTIINSQYGAWEPFIGPDESYMIFSSSKPGGYGVTDQYVSYYNKEDSAWPDPKNLGPNINSSKGEYGSYVTPDGKYYFFCRPEGWSLSDNADLYWVDTRAIFSDSLIGINTRKEIPKNFNLYQTYPYPFNPKTTIQYILQKSNNVMLKIYNLDDQEIEALINGFQPEGEYEISWQPEGLPSGIYFYRLQAGTYFIPQYVVRKERFFRFVHSSSTPLGIRFLESKFYCKGSAYCGGPLHFKNSPIRLIWFPQFGQQ